VSPEHPLLAGPVDPIVELGTALAEGGAQAVPGALRERALAAAAAARRPGAPLHPPARISGVEAMRRAVTALDELLAALPAEAWDRRALRELDVRGVVGHLLGIEEHFAVALAGGPDALAGGRHVAATQDAADRQAGRPPADVRRAWAAAASANVAAAAAVDPDALLPFYGIELRADDVLVVRAFELWVHEEDIRRAAGLPPADPDPERLARMVSLAARLLPAGASLAGVDRPAPPVRLVLVGAGGGTFDVRLDGGLPDAPPASRVVVGAADFCRIVGNREDGVTTGARLSGDLAVAADALAGAAALAFD
jgi:uncharacterized protein (TIGR03083 family)